MIVTKTLANSELEKAAIFEKWGEKKFYCDNNLKHFEVLQIIRNRVQMVSLTRTKCR